MVLTRSATPKKAFPSPPQQAKTCNIAKVKDIFDGIRTTSKKDYNNNCNRLMKNGHESGLSMDRVHVIQEANDLGYSKILACELVWFHNLFTSDANDSSEIEIRLIFAKEERLIGTYQLYKGQVNHKIGSSDSKNFVYFPVPSDEADAMFVVVEAKCNVVSAGNHITRRRSQAKTEKVVYHGVHKCINMKEAFTSVKKWLSVAGIPVFSKDDKMVSKLPIQFEKDIWMRSYRMLTDFASITVGAEDECTIACLHVEFVMERRNADWDVVKDIMDIDHLSNEEEKRVEFIAYEHEPLPDGLSTVKSEVLCSAPAFFSPFYDGKSYGSVDNLVEELNKVHWNLFFDKVAVDVISVALKGTVDRYGVQCPNANLPDNALPIPMPAYYPVTVGGETFLRADPKNNRLYNIHRNHEILTDDDFNDDQKEFMVWWNDRMQEDLEKNPDDPYEPGYVARAVKRCIRDHAAAICDKDWDTNVLTSMMNLQKHGAITAQDYTYCFEVITEAF